MIVTAEDFVLLTGMLDQTDQLQCFEEGQEDVVMDVLLKMFTKSSLKVSAETLSFVRLKL